MTPKERVILAIKHKSPDRIPVDIRFSAESQMKLNNALSKTTKEVEEWLGQDVIPIRPFYKKSVSTIKYADPTIKIDEHGYYIDIYGVPFKRIKSEFQDYLENTELLPLKEYDSEESLNLYPWPKTEDWDYSLLESEIDKHWQKATWCRSRGFFTTAQMMRGMDTFLVDLSLNPDFAMNIANHIMEFVFEDAEKSLKSGNGKYTFIEYNDDVGMQTSMMISPDMWRKYVKPIVKKFCTLAHKYNAYCKVHSCGSIYPIIPDLIEIGADILNPIQPLAKNMDPFRLKKEFGKDICLHGGVDIQNLLPYASPVEVKDTVHRLIDEVGKDGGYILSSSHTVQADAKIENLIALREAIYE